MHVSLFLIIAYDQNYAACEATLSDVSIATKAENVPLWMSVGTLLGRPERERRRSLRFKIRRGRTFEDNSSHSTTGTWNARRTRPSHSRNHRTWGSPVVPVPNLCTSSARYPALYD